jgi:hypothetical protein
MGAVKLSYDNNIANNPNYKGGGVVKTSSPFVSTTVSDLENNVLSRIATRGALGVAGRVFSRFVPILSQAQMVYDVGSLASSVVSSLSTPDMETIEVVHHMKKPAVSTSSSGVVKSNSTPTNDPQSTLAYELNKTRAEQQKALEGSLSGVEDGISTPVVETTLPDVMRENTLALVQAINYLTLAITKGSGDVSSSLQGMLMQGDTMTQLKQAEYQQRDQHKYIDIQLWKAFLENGAKAFEKYKPTEVDMDFMKPFYEKGAEDYDYKKNPLSIRDLDGQTVATHSPREIEAIKNATLSRKTTDENNLELDEEDFDIMDSLPDISSIFKYERQAPIIESIIRNESSL